MTVQACTIIARNYLPLARVLGTSFRAHHPDGRLSVLLFDDVDHDVDDGDEPFDILRIDDLDGAGELYRMAALYEVTEFATALKPWLLETLLRRGASSVLYLDPDIQVFHPLDDVARLAEERGIVLTPHVLRPMPRDGRMTTETSILASGIYNLGFVAVGRATMAADETPTPVTPGDRPFANTPRAAPAAPVAPAPAFRVGPLQPFLSFWKERLVRECLNDPQGMRFVDQRWVDFVPAIYDPVVLRSGAYNVAYWNLDQRDVTWTGEGYEVDGAPLQFFHFSGFDPRQGHLLSKHQGDRPRILLSERPAVRRLCDAYADLLFEAGYGRETPPPYAFGTMANGVVIDRYVRRILVDATRSADGGIDVHPPLPWTAEGATELCEWLRAAPGVDGDPGRLSVYLATVFGINVNELRPRFFDPQGADRASFLAWAREEAAAGRLVAELVPDDDGLPPVRADAATAPPPPSPPPPPDLWAPPGRVHPGITVAGYLRAELGVGEGARLLVRCVEEAGIPVSTFVVTDTLSRQSHEFRTVGGDRRDFDVNIVCVNADELPRFAATVGPGFFEGRHTIGQWAWELEEFPPEWGAAAGVLQEIWAVSEFTRGAIAEAVDIPVRAFPHAVVAPEVAEGVDRVQLGLPEDRFVFLFCFDLLSVLERKNPLGLIEAFVRAFPEPGPGPTVGGDGAGPLLVLKVINGERAVSNLERIRVTAADRPDIVVVDGYLDAPHVAALMAAADCYVSLHRSEGFGLTMAESMALGTPVIATGYSGNLEFMVESTAYLVPFEFTAVGPGADPYPAAARWADPDLDVAAQLMARVAAHPGEADAMGRRARGHIEAHHGPAARAAFVRSRFHAVEAARAAQLADAAASAEPAPGPTSRLGRLIGR